MAPQRILYPLVVMLLALLIVAPAVRAQDGTKSGQRPERSGTSPTRVRSSVPADSSPSDTVLRDEQQTVTKRVAAGRTIRNRDLIASLTIFVLAIFVGFEVIVKVPPTLHTPLMSGSNAISGITIVGAIVIAGAGLWGVEPIVGFIAVVLATINVVGGFVVTNRMLMMFQRKHQ